MKLLNFKKLSSLLFIPFFVCIFSYAQEDSFSKGEELFKLNQPEQAVPFLKDTIIEGGNPAAYTYLALSYYQLGRYTESLDICKIAMNISGTNKTVIAYNAGNVSYNLGDYSDAEIWYTKSLEADATYVPPLLNRANARLKQGKFRECKEDYVRYQELEPDNYQKEQIDALLALLDGEIERIAQGEASKPADIIYINAGTAIVNGENVSGGGTGYGGSGGYGTGDGSGGYGSGRVPTAEELRAMEQARREAEEAERKRKLLEDVASSLQDAESQNMTAGAEGTVDYGYESELE